MDSRRDFIRKTSLGGIGVMITSNFLVSTTLSVPEQTLSQQLFNAANLRKIGNINGAIQLFDIIISNYPSELRAYDGKRLCLAKQKHKEQSIYNMFHQAFQQFPNNPEFKMRWARTAMMLALGNQKFSEIISSREALLEQAKLAFEELTIEYPDNVQYRDLLKKAKDKIDFNVISIDPRINQDVRDNKSEERRKYKIRLHHLSYETLQNKLQYLLSKEVDEKRNKKIKELYLVIFRKSFADRNFNVLFQILEEFYSWNKLDTNTINFIRVTCNKFNNYDFLASIEQQNHFIRNTIWSAISYSEAIIKRKKHTNLGDISEIHGILNASDLKITNAIQLFEKNYILATTMLMQNRTQEAKELLTQLSKELIGTTNNEFLVRYTVLIAKYYKSIQKNELMQLTLKIGLQSTDEAKGEELLKSLIELVKDAKLSEKDYHAEYILRYKSKLES